MYKGKRVAAVVPAAGVGSRMGGDLPKQFLSLEGTPILVHTLEALRSSGVIDSYIVALDPSVMDVASRIPPERFETLRIVGGGAHRQESVLNALLAIDEDRTDVVLIHDAVRPCVSTELILEVIGAAIEAGAAAPAVTPQETVKQVDASNIVVRTIDRDQLRLVQTPQGFLLGMIVEAHKRARRENFHATDDAALVEHMGGKVRLVNGSHDNIKITFPGDLETASRWLRSRLKQQAS